MLRDCFLLLTGKIIAMVSRFSGRNGAALPGYVIERIDAKFLGRMLSKLPEGVVVVTGTNGKTTTTKMISELLSDQGKKVLTNKTGSNFVRGIISYVVKHSTVFAKLPYDIAVIELDEAYAVKFVELVKPRGVVVLNITRDQLDRFGEIDTTAKMLQKVVRESTEFVVLNDDDIRVRGLLAGKGVDVYRFGVSESLGNNFISDNALYSSHEEDPIEKTYREAELVGLSPSVIIFRKEKHTFNLKMTGSHNSLNACAAILAAKISYPDFDIDRGVQALTSIKSAFGRGEYIDWNNRKVILQLVKNPLSFKQSIKIIDEVKPDLIVVLVNDKYADSRDVSWLWDVDFSVFKSYSVMTGGSRSYDIAVRLNYENVYPEVIPQGKELAFFKRSSKTGSTILVFATYTAMLHTRRMLKGVKGAQKI